MNPRDDDRQSNDDLFPEAGQYSSHNFYGSQPRITEPEPFPVAEELEPVETEFTDELCPECGSSLVIKQGTLSDYIACSRFPECKFTKPLEEEAEPQGHQQTRESEEQPRQSYNDYNDPSHQDQYNEDTSTALSADYLEGYAEEPSTQQYNQDSEEQAHEQPTNLPPEPYFSPSIYGQPTEEEPYDEQQEQVEVLNEKIELEKPEEPTKADVNIQDTDRSVLLHHPVFLDKKAVAESAKWVELKQKRLMDQKRKAGAPAVMPGEALPDPAELEETLRKLESDVQKMQEQDRQIQPPLPSSVPNPHRAKLDDDDDYFTD